MQNFINNIFKNIFDVLTTMLAGFVPDAGTRWGLAIILFTFLFLLITFPLNWKSLKSNKKMSELQPQMKEIQEKYKNDPQRAQQEQAKLFKENNVSMLGGCLPMLIQWPLFIAMFNVFRELANSTGPNSLRGLSFLPPLVKDLAATHNIYLTILTVVTMLLTQWITMKGQTTQNSQGSQMMIMTVVMSVMMAYFTYSQPAALGLYWVASNVFRMIQQLILNAVDKKERAGESI